MMERRWRREFISVMFADGRTLRGAEALREMRQEARMHPFTFDAFQDDWLPDRTLFVTVHGSHAYGLNTLESDVDHKGVCVPPPRYYHGFVSRFEQSERKEPADAVIYEIRKFFGLAADCNPNIIEVLFTDPQHHVVTTPLFGRVLEQRRKFLSKKARHTFGGYAHSQLKRIQTHRRWLLDPPKAPPSRSEYGLPEQAKLSQSELGAAEKLAESMDLGRDFTDLMLRERQYQSAKREWEQYQRWKRERNPKRAHMEAQFGYDCKHAMHLVRLMRMCCEILEHGEVRVYRRDDADELLAIRRGEWSYERVIGEAEDLESKAQDLKDWSPLPSKPDRVGLDELCCEIVEAML